MTEKDIVDAYCRIRKIDQTIPDDVLDFMKDAAIFKLKLINSQDPRGNPLIGEDDSWVHDVEMGSR